MSLHNFIRQARLLLAQSLYETRRAMTTQDDWSSRPLEVTQLEERVLMSASPLVVVAEAPAPDSVTLQLSDQQLLDVVADSVLPEQSSNTATADSAAATQTLELVFLDNSISDLDQMIADLQSQSASDESRTLEVVVLDSQQDGIAQITSALLNYKDIDGIHIVSHGGDGQVQLGATRLSLDNLDTYRSAINAWQYSMSDQADLLFYGCDLAATEDGQSLMNQIAAETNSDDLTGHESLGGDWELEYQAGIIETQVAFTTDFQQSWSHVLNVAVDASSNGTTLDQASKTVSHTTSGTNRLMLVSVTMDPHGDSVSSITYNGVNLSLVGVQDTGNHSRSEIWSLVAPDTGTHDVVVSLTGTLHKGVTVGVMTFTEVDQVTPLLNFTGSSGDSSTASTTVTSANDDLMFGVVDSHLGSASTPGAGQTEYFDITIGQSNSSGTVEAGAASVTTSWTVVNDKWSVAAVSIQAAPPSPIITASETMDVDGDGQIDQIKITMDENLDDDFSGLTTSVVGYTVTGYSTGIANDNIFYVNLTESGSTDTDATPLVLITANTTLSKSDGTVNVTATDWWDTDWQNRKRITFDNTASAENLTDFPLLVRLTAADVDFAKIKADGADMAPSSEYSDPPICVGRISVGSNAAFSAPDMAQAGHSSSLEVCGSGVPQLGHCFCSEVFILGVLSRVSLFT
ncbi:MAG: DUF4347 domain-containing protein [Fuerstiella sp.]